MSGYSEKAPDLKQAIFDKMDARMSGEAFEEAVKEKLADYSVKAPNVLERVFGVRTGWFVFTNKLLLGVERYRYAVLTIVVAALLWTSWSDFSRNRLNDGAQIAQEDNRNAQTAQNAENTGAVTHQQESTDEFNNLNAAPDTRDAAQNESGLTGSQDREGTSIPGNRTGGNTSDANASDNRTVIENNNTEQELPVTGEVVREAGELTEDPLQKPEQPDEPVADEIAVVQDNEIQSGDGDSLTELEKLDEFADAETRNVEIKTAPIRHYSLEVYYAPAYAGRTLKAGNNMLINARNSSERVRYSYGLGLRFNYELSESWEIQTGFEYHVRRELVDFTLKKEFEEMNVETRKVVYKDPVLPDRVVEFHDTSYSNYVVRTKNTSHNSYSSFTVPLLLRYTVYYNQWGLYLNSGLRLGVWNKQTGYVVNSSMELQNVNQGVYSERLFRPSFQLGMGAMYRFSDRWSMIAEPCTVIGLRSVTSGNYGLEQYDKSFSLILGARLNF